MRPLTLEKRPLSPFSYRIEARASQYLTCDHQKMLGFSVALGFPFHFGMVRALRVLLVEDDNDDAVVFQESLKGASVKVTRVAGADAAILWLSVGNQSPDLIVLDVSLKGSRPEKLLDWAEVHPVAKGIPICIYTGASIIDARLKNRVRGAFLKKGDPAGIRSTFEQMRAFLPRFDEG